MLLRGIGVGMLGVAISASAVVRPQNEPVELSVRVALIDKELRVRPVPKTLFVLERMAAAGDSSTPLQLTTGFDGRVAVDIPAGRYKLKSAQPVEFQDKKYAWDIEIEVEAPQTDIELSNDNARILNEDATPAAGELSVLAAKLENSILTIYAEMGPSKGTGFAVDSAGLIITNQHVVRDSQFIAAQFDATHMVRATLVASDAARDVAVLRIDPAGLPQLIVAPLPVDGSSLPKAGEAVFTIGSPLNQDKIVTKGVISKAQPRAILSDININHGNSGGPLFNARGEVIGITTFADSDTAGKISGCIRIEEAIPVLDDARRKMAGMPKPSGELLPAPPTDSYPLDALKERLKDTTLRIDPYVFSAGDYNVEIVTPVALHMSYAGKAAALRQREHRSEKASASKETFDPLADLKAWAEYLGEYAPVLWIWAQPKFSQTLGSKISREMIGSRYGGSERYRFKADFSRMSLFCGDKEIVPLLPGKTDIVVDQKSRGLDARDATYAGFYEYPPSGISEACGKVSLQIYSAKNPKQPANIALDKKTIAAVDADFKPYFEQRSASH